MYNAIVIRHSHSEIYIPKLMILEHPSLPSGPIFTSNVPSIFSIWSSSLVIAISSIRSEPNDNDCKGLLFTL